VVHRLADGAEVLPSQITTSGVPAARLEDAARALRDATARWAALAPGETWAVDWAPAPARRTLRRGAHLSARLPLRRG
jgi:hypothetical protein